MEASIRLHAPVTLPPVKERCPSQLSNRVGDWFCPRVGVQALEKTKESYLPGVELRCQLLWYHDSRRSYKAGHTTGPTKWSALGFMVYPETLSASQMVRSRCYNFWWISPEIQTSRMKPSNAQSATSSTLPPPPLSLQPQILIHPEDDNCNFVESSFLNGPTPNADQTHRTLLLLL